MKRVSILAALFVMSGLLVFLTFNAEAATYWVDGVNGRDSNPCINSSTPLTTSAKRTITNALVQCMRSGDTLYIRSGVYSESLSRSSTSLFPNGTPANYTRIVRWQSESVMIRPPFSGPGCSSDGNCRAIYLTGNRYIEFDGLILDGVNQTIAHGSSCADKKATSGINAIQADACPICRYTERNPDAYTHHIRFKNMEIRNWPGYAFSVGGPQVSGCIGCAGNHELINNVIHNVGLNRYQGQNVAFYGSTANWLVEKNKIYDVPSAITLFNTTAGVSGPSGWIIRYNEIYNVANVHPGCDIGPAIIVASNDANPFIHDNLIYNSKNRGIETKHFTNNNTRIFRNLLYNNKVAGIKIHETSTNVVVANNVVYQGPAGGTAIINKSESTVLADNVITRKALSMLPAKVLRFGPAD